MSYIAYGKNPLHKFAWRISERLSLIDHIFTKDGGKDILSKYPPFFIVGVPRSGTTLLMQLLTSTYRFVYFTNLTRIFIGAPFIATKLQMSFMGDFKNSKFVSSYGRTRGWESPNDAVRFWCRWFPFEEPAHVHDINLIKRPEDLRDTIGALSKLKQAPFLTKDMRNSLRIPALLKLFPEAIWIYIKRNPLFIAQSLYVGRKKIFKNTNEWIGLKPFEYKKLLKKPPLEQIANQVYLLRQEIEQGLDYVPDDKKLIINYETLCESIGIEFEKLENKFNHKGEVLSMVSSISNSNIISGNERKIEKSEFDKLKEIIDNLYQ